MTQDLIDLINREIIVNPVSKPVKDGTEQRLRIRAYDKACTLSNKIKSHGGTDAERALVKSLFDYHYQRDM